ncbi:MAG: N-acetylmuramoyl-L-alanine amidase [Clostridia bacterium]|nr:N-acetylmuramoyl-L-alanine amidase [Clostridia bacterium]
MWSTCAVLSMLIIVVAFIGYTSRTTSEKMTALNAELDEALSEIEALEKNYNEAQDEIDTLRADNAVARKEMDTLKAINEAAQEEIDSLKNSNATARQEIESLKGDIHAAQEEIDSLEQSNQTAKQEIDALRGSNAAAREEIDSLKGSNATMQQEIDSLKSDNEAAKEEIERLKAQIQELQNGLTPDEPTEKIKIYIDQGHNPSSYHNSGASGNGMYEQDLTFAIGHLLADLLEEDGRFEICLSRPTADTVLGTDNSSSLDARVQGAVDFGADYFISLHINSYSDTSANGIEVLVAEQGSTSYDFGSYLLQGMINSTNLRNRGMKLNPNLRVLKNATMPAALLEMGFISNSTDAALLSQSPELFAEGIYDGILAYFELPASEALAA